jgi:hypothetical protein
MAVQDSLHTLAKTLNAAAMRRLGNLREPSRSRRWPLLGMFAIGLVAGAIGSFAVTQRSELKRLAELAFRMKGRVEDESAAVKNADPVAVTTRRSNHRRKRVAEVTEP